MPMQPVNISDTGYQMFLDDESVFAPRERGLERQAKQNALARQQAVRNALAQSINPKTGLTNYEFAQQIGGVDIAPELQAAQQADILARTELRGKRATALKAETDAAKTDNDLLLSQLQTMGGLIGAAVDEPTYQLNVRKAASMGYDVSELPPNFDANYVANLQKRTLTAQQQLERSSPKLEVANLGGTQQPYNPYTGKPVGSGMAVSRSPNTQTTNINLPALPKKEQEDKGSLNVEIYKGIREVAARGRKTEPAIDTALAVLDKGFGTGTGTETKAKIAGVLSLLGVPEAEKYANDAAVFQSTVQQTVLDRQYEQKGPQTEQDAIRITQTAANLGNPTDANRFLLNVAKAQIKRDNAQQRFFDKWWNTNKTYEGAEEAWINGEGSKSLFADPALAKYAPKKEQASAAAAAPPNAAAIQHLRSNPSLAAAFDEFYGAGASAKYLPKGK